MCNSSKSEKSTGVVFALLCSLRSLHYDIRTVQSPHSSYNTPECGIRIRKYKAANTRHSVRHATTQSSLLLATRFA